MGETVRYCLKTEDLLLELEPRVYEGDMEYSVNTSLRVKVSSCGFSAACVLDIDVRDLGEFAARLHRLYETLEGSARLEEPYGFHSYIRFTAAKKGHVEVRGRLRNGGAHGYEQELQFENEVEQTYLRELAQRLYTDYGKKMG